MKLSRTAIKELTAKYRAVLLKCAILNMAAFTIAMATATPAKAEPTNDFSDLAGAIAAGSPTSIALSANIRLETGGAAPTSLGQVGANMTISADYGNTIYGTSYGYSSDPVLYNHANGISVGAQKSLTLNGLTFEDFTTYDVNNLGTLALNSVDLKTGVQGTGSTTVTGESKVASMTQKDVTVNGRLEIAAGNLTVTNSAKRVTIGSSGILAFTAGVSTAADNIATIANAGSITTTGAVKLANSLTGNGTVTINSGSTLTFVGANNSNAISGVGNGALQIGDGTAMELTTTGALNIATNVSANATLNANANLIGGTLTNAGTVYLTAGNSNATKVLSSQVENTKDGTLYLTDVTANADIKNTTSTGAPGTANLWIAGNVTLANLLKDAPVDDSPENATFGVARLDALSVDTTLTFTGRVNTNKIEAVEGNGHTANIVVSNNGETNNLNALETTGAFLADTTINAGAALIADADMLGSNTASIDITNNGTLAMEGGDDLENVKVARADIENKKDVLITDGHVALAGDLEGAGKVTLVADSAKGTSLTLMGTKNDNRIDAEISEGEGHVAALHIVNTGDSTHANPNNPNALTNTGDLNVDVTIANGARLITAANLIGKDVEEGKEITVTNNGNLVLSGLTLPANTLSRNVLGTGTTTLRKNAALADGVILDNALEIDTKTLSGDHAFANATGNSSIANGGEISVADLTVLNVNTAAQAFDGAEPETAQTFANAGTVSSPKLTIGAIEALTYTVFDNTAATAKITGADLKINEMGVLKTAGTNLETETIKNNGTLVLNGATQNTVAGDVVEEVQQGTTINNAGASTIATLTQKEVDVKAGSLTVTGTATISTKVDVDAGAALNLTGTTGETAPMEIAAANVKNDGTINTTGKVLFKGNVSHDAEKGTIALADAAELTLAGTGNSSTISASAHNAAKLIIKNGEGVAQLINQGTLLVDTDIKSGSDMSSEANYIGKNEAEVITRINVTNDGRLALKNWTDADGNTKTAYANIVNNNTDMNGFIISSTDTRRVVVDGNIVNNGRIDASGKATIKGNLTGSIPGATEADPAQPGMVALADGAELTLNGTNSNTIRANAHDAAKLIFDNDEMKLNTGKLLVDTEITDGSTVRSGANFLGAEGDGNTIDVTNNGTLELTGVGEEKIAYANIANVAAADLMNVTGTVRLNGNLTGAGTTTLIANDAVGNASLTLAGTSNTNTIAADITGEHTANLFVTNTGVMHDATPENNTALVNTGNVLVDTTITDGSAMITNADNLGATVTNYGIVELNGGTLVSNINLADDDANIIINGNVTSNVALAKAEVKKMNTLTIAANNVGEFTLESDAATPAEIAAGNTAQVVLTGNTLSNALSGGLISLTGNVTYGTGASFANSVVDLGGHGLTLAANSMQAYSLANGTINITLAENATADTLVSTAVDADNVTLKVGIANVSKLSVQQYHVTDKDGYTLDLQGNPANYAISDHEFGIEQAQDIQGQFNQALWEGGDLYMLKVEAVARVAAEQLIESGIGVSQNEQGAVKILADDDVYNAMTAGQKATVDRINNMLAVALDSNSEGQAKQILKEVGAEKAPAVAQSEAANVGAVMNVVGSRLGGAAPAPAAAGADKGRSGGNEFFVGKTAVWGQMMFNTAKLDRTDGFDSDSTGFALGAEYKINDEYKVGFGYAFTTTDLKTDRSKTDVDTHTGFLYGEYKPNNFYVNGVLSFGTSSYDEKTKLTNITADYDATTFGIQAMAGYTFGIITPEAGLRYTNVKQDAYTNSLGVRAGSKTNEMLTAVAGAKYAQAFRVGNDFILTPEAKVAMTYDIDRSKQDRSITLANGAGYISEGQNMNRFGLELGAGVSFKVNNAIDIGVSYEGKFKKDYSDHTGLLNVKYNF